MIGNVLVLIITGIFFLDKFVMSIYCRLMEIIDKRESKMTREHRRIKEENNANFTKIFLKILPLNEMKKIVNFLIYHFLYGWMRYSIIMSGKIPSHFIRNFFYRYIYNMKITGKTIIGGGCEIRSPWNFYAGKCIIMNNCILDARAGIIIEDEVVFGQGVHIWTEEHDVNSPEFRVTENTRGTVKIKKRAWICSDSTILPGVEIGEGAVLASRACATKNLDAFYIYAGIPAIIIKKRNNQLVYKIPEKPHWNFY